MDTLEWKKKRWDYKLVESIWEHYPSDNLCKYVRQVVASILLVICGGIVVIPLAPSIVLMSLGEKYPLSKKNENFGFGLSLVLGGVGLFITGTIAYLFSNHLQPVSTLEQIAAFISATGFFFGAIVFVIALIALIIFSIANWRTKRNYQIQTGQIKKSPSLVIAYLKAKKEKVCPKIKWVD